MLASGTGRGARLFGVEGIQGGEPVKTKLMTFAAAMAIAAGAAVIATGPNASAAAQRNMVASRATMAYIVKAGAGDLYEIQSSELAARRARQPAVRRFAQMLVADHNRSTREIMAAARASGLSPSPPMLDPNQRRMMRELERAPAARFDRIYLQQQIPAHQQALALHRDYARRGDRPALRRVTTAIVPVVQGHLTHARQLAR
jgi:putative membrane protein